MFCIDCPSTTTGKQVSRRSSLFLALAALGIAYGNPIDTMDSQPVVTVSTLGDASAGAGDGFIANFPQPGCNCINCLGLANRNDGHKFRSFVSLASEDISGASEHVRDILEHNQKWVRDTNEHDPTFFTNLAKPQKPKYLYFGCSDSRVPANQILGLGPGEVFVHRNIGNQVPGNDLNALSVLEYAVVYLNITDVIVTGHYDCGAIRAATSRQDLGTLEHWLRSIRDIYRLHRADLDDLESEEDRHYALVELNVIEQCVNLFKSGVIQRKRIQTRKALLASGRTVEELGEDVYPRIHGMVFNPADGVLKKLPVDFEQRLGPLDHIYGLYNETFIA